MDENTIAVQTTRSISVSSVNLSSSKTKTDLLVVGSSGLGSNEIPEPKHPERFVNPCQWYPRRRSHFPDEFNPFKFLMKRPLHSLNVQLSQPVAVREAISPEFTMNKVGWIIVKIDSDAAEVNL